MRHEKHRDLIVIDFVFTIVASNLCLRNDSPRA
ncbi:hypothetical protein A1F99_044330 [Pyrenophora tritici-repentis]|nr:hypothetical protein A1F99_044330 [Pyrenophora tritici-repentis]